MTNLKRALLFVAALTVFTAAAIETFYSGYWRFNYPSAAEYPVRGIDVSRHQGKIDWAAVAGSGVRFAYIKASEGGDHRDQRFPENWSAAKAAGLSRGAYHFFTFCKPGAEQAANFVGAVPVTADALPPAIDFEFVGNCKRRPPREEVHKELEDFTKALRARYKKEPVLYATRSAYERYLSEAPPPARLWSRDILQKPTGAWTFWQFAENVRVPGVARPADQNVFNGSERDFEAFVKAGL